MTAPQLSRPQPVSKTNPPPSSSPSILQSPRSSRDSSPAPFVASSNSGTASAGSRGMRSRKNSHEVSPHRQSNLSSTVPSAAAIQRALSGAGVPQLQPTITTETSSRIPRSQRNGSNDASSRDSPSWPTSPRLKSPSPSSRSRKSSLVNQRKPGESGTPSIVVQRVATDPPDEDTDNSASKSGNARVASTKSTLETVQESSSNPVTPSELVNNPERYECWVPIYLLP
jgi:hypothetical protein